VQAVQDSDVRHADGDAEHIQQVKCWRCGKSYFACTICVRTWITSRQNSRHLNAAVHLAALESLNLSIPSAEALRDDDAPHQEDDDDWGTTNNGDGMDFDYDPHPREDDHSNGSPPAIKNKSDDGDWLTSIPDQLGNPATTLEAIVQSGAFPVDSKSPEFYYFESQCPGQGAKYLAAKPFDVPPERLSNEEAEFHLRITKFLTRLTRTDQEELAYCMFHARNSGDESLSIFKATRPPTSTDDFKEFYMGGKKSVTKHLPTPVVNKTPDNNHSYVTLTDVIQNMLAASTSVDQFQFETNMQEDFFEDDGRPTISKTRAAYSLYLDLKKDEGPGFVLYLWIKHWCDDFDPNNTKQSRNQVWLLTSTICPPRDENKGRNTCFMAIGQKGDDHQEIHELFEQEMKELSVSGRMFYHGGRKEFLKVKAGTVCVCVDRPERASLYEVGDHKGTYSTYWGHAVDVDGKCEDNCLPSCPFCRRQRLINARIVSDECPAENKCVSWNVMDSKFTFKAPTGYPTVCDKSEGAPLAPVGREITETDDCRLPCVYLTIPWLRQAVVFAHHNMQTRRTPRSTKKFWTKANLVAYLRTCGISAKMYDSVYESAMQKSTKVPMPITWGADNALRLTHFAAMHMLFLGHGKSNYNMTMKFHSKYSILATVGKQTNIYLRDIQALRCNRFFDAQPLSTSKWGTGVWVSENYLFWVRTVNFFCTLPSIVNNKTHATKPEFQKDVRMLHRFCSSSLAAISRIMTDKKSVGDMDNVAKIYLDTMVEMDRWLVKEGLTSDDPNDSFVAAGTDDLQASNSAAQPEGDGAPASDLASTDKGQARASSSAAHQSNSGNNAAHQPNSSTAPANSSAARAISASDGAPVNNTAARPTKRKRKKKKAPPSANSGAALGNSASVGAPANNMEEAPVNNTAAQQPSKKRRKNKKKATPSANSSAALANSATDGAPANNTDDEQPKEKKKRRKRAPVYNYNFRKSNSLGILAVAESHRYLGPAMLHWEGGWAGERKIQQAKPLLGIKRATADWQRIVLENLWRDNTLSSLIGTLSSDQGATTDSQREIEGSLKVYSNVSVLTKELERCKPLSGMLAQDGTVWVGYRPTKEEFLLDEAKPTNSAWSRSAIQFLNLQFDDEGAGRLVSDLCWFAPIAVVHGKTLTLGNPGELKDHVAQYVLLLPRLGDDDKYQNMFYVVGSNWTQRVSSGAFEQPQLSSALFEDWTTMMS